MPNWCNNKLVIKGKKKDLITVCENVKSEKSVLDENKILPYPEEYRFKDEAYEKWEKDKNVLVKKFTESDGKVSNKNYKSILESLGEQPKSGFATGGLEWCVVNWGTKWGFVDAELTRQTNFSLVYRFVTAYSPPIPLIIKLGLLFPACIFKLYYNESGMRFKGTLIIENGEVIKNEETNY